jgi:glyoxylase-like metal-dependent hydrolase (beta-lactamase superfamily II)
MTHDPFAPRRWHVGDVTITALLEVAWPLRLDWMVAGATPDAIEALPWVRAGGCVHDAGEMTIAVQLFVVESEGRRIVVDTCAGNGKPRTGAASVFDGLDGDLEARCAAAGLPFDTVDTVVCTHLHFDHVGWNTRFDGERWRPTFAPARYVFSAADLAHWAERPDPLHAAAFDDSVAPVVDAGLVRAVAPPFEVTPEVRLVPTPGHTPGHASVWVSSRGHDAVITGDMVHHPVQLARPEWRDVSDVDHERAVDTRRAFVGEVAGTGVLVLGTHFPAPTAGTVQPVDGDLRFVVPSI